MRTSVPGSDRILPPPLGEGGGGGSRSVLGFTLLELLVVVAIIAFATAGVSFALRDSSATQLEREAQRLAAILEAARAQSRGSGVAVRWQAGERSGRAPAPGDPSRKATAVRSRGMQAAAAAVAPPSSGSRPGAGRGRRRPRRSRSSPSAARSRAAGGAAERRCEPPVGSSDALAIGRLGGDRRFRSGSCRSGRGRAPARPARSPRGS